MYCSMTAAGICTGGASGFRGRICFVVEGSRVEAIGEGAALGGSGLWIVTAAATASRSIPASLAPKSRRADTVLQGSVIENPR